MVAPRFYRGPPDERGWDLKNKWMWIIVGLGFLVLMYRRGSDADDQWLVAAFGLTMAAWAFPVAWRHLHNYRTWTVTSGVVVQHRLVGADRVSAPIVEYQTADGQRLRGDDGFSTTGGRFAVGAEVPVRYNPAEPTKIIVGGHSQVVFLLFFGSFGAIVALSYALGWAT